MRLFELCIGGLDYFVTRVSGRTALSGLFRFEVDAYVTDSAQAPREAVGQTCVLTMRDPFDRTYAYAGLITEARRNAGGAAIGTASFVVEPAVAALAVGRDHRLFQEMNAVDIIKKVLDGAGVDPSGVRWAVSASYPVRAYCVQYAESDWAFVERLAREEGIYYWFDPTDDATVLVFADDSTTAPEIDGGATVPFHEDDALRATRDSVVRVTRQARAVSDAARLRDYSFEKPRLTLDSRAGSGAREVYDFPGRFQVPADGDRLARVTLESKRAMGVVTSGETNSVRLFAGRVFELTEHPVESLNTRLLLVEVAYEATEATGGPNAQGGEPGPCFTWKAIPVATPFRAPRGEVTAHPGGVQTGVVVGAPGEEIHPDAMGRVRVQHYWDREGKRDDKASTWMRVGQFPLGGSMILPRVGWDLVVGHHEGDIDAPFVMSHLYDGQHPVPYPLPANKSRTAWQTATTPGGGSSNEIRFEDKKGSEEMFINSTKDTNIVVGDNRSESVGVDYDVTIGANRQVSVGANASVTVGAQQDVSIGGSESLTVSGSRAVTIAASESATVGGSRSVTAIGGASLDAKGGRSLTVGGTMLAASVAQVSRSVLGSLNLSVGGAWITAAATGLANVTVGAGAETVGGAKLAIGAAGCATTVKGACAETVGGAYVVAAGGNAGETATGALAITVGGAFLANAPSIEIEADVEITIRCGGSSISITNGSIEVKSALLASPGATIDKGASSIHHN